MRVIRVVVPTVRVRLPDFDEPVRNWLAVAGKQLPADCDAVASRRVGHKAIRPLGSVPDQKLEERSNCVERREASHRVQPFVRFVVQMPAGVALRPRRTKSKR